MAVGRINRNVYNNRWKATTTPKLDQFRRSHKEKRDENRELCEKAFNEFCDIIGCEPSELTKKVARGGGFYIALKYVCAYFIHVRGGNDGNIGRLLRKERTTILHGRNEVAYLIKSNNFSGRLYYKFLIEKAFSKTNIIDKGIPQHAFDAIL